MVHSLHYVHRAGKTQADNYQNIEQAFTTMLSEYRKLTKYIPIGDVRIENMDFFFYTCKIKLANTVRSPDWSKQAYIYIYFFRWANFSRLTKSNSFLPKSRGTSYFTVGSIRFTTQNHLRSSEADLDGRTNGKETINVVKYLSFSQVRSEFAVAFQSSFMEAVPGTNWSGLTYTTKEKWSDNFDYT